MTLKLLFMRFDGNNMMLSCGAVVLAAVLILILAINSCVVSISKFIFQAIWGNNNRSFLFSKDAEYRYQSWSNNFRSGYQSWSGGMSKIESNSSTRLQYIQICLSVTYE